MRRKVENLLISLAFLSLVSSAGAAEYEPYYEEPPVLRGGYFEIGARYWYSMGQTDFDLYDDTGSLLISRLTYDGLDAHSGELFFKSQHDSGWFVKGYGGIGMVPAGSLKDEDFPPVVDPYSSTVSAQQDGVLKYLSADIGYPFFGSYGAAGRFEIAAFTGYHYWNEQVHAYGCTQLAANPFICEPALASGVNVISNEVEWHSWRVGVMGTFDMGNGLRFTGEAAWVPYTWLDNVDNHHLRPDINPAPSDGDGHGLQLEAVVNYDVNERFSIGAGGRYWRVGRTDGFAHFEETPGGGIPQVVKFQSERYGAFVQASMTFE